MISEKSKKAIDALSEQELRFEIELGSQSRFQREKYVYLRVRLAEIENTPKEAAQDNSKMKIFLSWSGHSSHQVAVAIRDWLPTVLPFTEPWVSSEDIDKGARWASEIATVLNDANFGIICLVPGNLNEPWLNFEAGAISKVLEAGKVAPLLVGLDRNEAKDGPLAQFQNTLFNMNDVRQLVLSMNRAHNEPLADGAVLKNFQVCWRSLEESVNGIDLNSVVEVVVQEQVQAQGELSEKEVLILMLLASIDGEEILPEQIAQQIDENVTRTKYYMDRLEAMNYVRISIVMGEGISYSIADGGREYLVEHDLV